MAGEIDDVEMCTMCVIMVITKEVFRMLYVIFFLAFFLEVFGERQKR